MQTPAYLIILDRRPESVSKSAIHQYDRPVYHVLGKHDIDSILKRDFLANTKIKNHRATEGESYYSFVYNRLKFIALDANMTSVISNGHPPEYPEVRYCGFFNCEDKFLKYNTL